MAVSKEEVVNFIKAFRVRLLQEIRDGWVEDEAGKSLMTQEQSEQLAGLVAASTEEHFTQADIDALFADSTASGDDTVTGGDTASGGSTGSGRAADADRGVDDEL